MTTNTEHVKESYVSNPIQAIKIAIKRLIETNLKPIILLTVLGFGALILAVALIVLIATSIGAAGTAGTGAVALLVLAALPFFLLAGVVWQVASDFMYVKSQKHQTVTIKQALRRGLERMWTAIGANILLLILVLGGVILFVIPGIYVALRLSYVQSVVANENLGPWESINKSWQLTKGNLWDIIGVGAAVTAAYATLLVIAIGIIHAIVGDNVSTYSWIGDVVLIPVTLLLASGLYFRYHQSSLEKDTKITKEGTSGLNYLLVIPALIAAAALSANTSSLTPTIDPGADSRIEYEFPGFRT